MRDTFFGLTFTPVSHPKNNRGTFNKGVEQTPDNRFFLFILSSMPGAAHARR